MRVVSELVAVVTVDMIVVKVVGMEVKIDGSGAEGEIYSKHSIY